MKGPSNLLHSCYWIFGLFGGFSFNSIWCGQSVFHLCRPHPTTLYEGQENLRFWNAIGGKEKYYTEKRKEVSLCLGSIRKTSSMNTRTIELRSNEKRCYISHYFACKWLYSIDRQRHIKAKLQKSIVYLF